MNPCRISAGDRYAACTLKDGCGDDFIVHHHSEYGLAGPALNPKQRFEEDRQKSRALNRIGWLRQAAALIGGSLMNARPRARAASGYCSGKMIEAVGR